MQLSKRLLHLQLRQIRTNNIFLPNNIFKDLAVKSEVFY